MRSAGDRVFDVAELRCLILFHFSHSLEDTLEDLQSLLHLTAVNRSLRNYVLGDPRCRRLLYLDAVTCDSIAANPSEKHVSGSEEIICDVCSCVPSSDFPEDLAVNPLLRYHFPELCFDWDNGCLTVFLGRSALSNLFGSARSCEEASCREMLLTQPPPTRLYVTGWRKRGVWLPVDKGVVRMGEVLDVIETVKAEEMEAEVI
ncbi:hypothetical protein H2201_007453 [Coniosporium apollinis]|uniref:F-box domain-containing protein n=1 Tax=Coniosporium apollinis TaxID=61459 RepID=A0ABQ9NN55_9PEZI|nr:hypothetical protein H2201_007453 [Coniosporium apollinis]